MSGELHGVHTTVQLLYMYRYRYSASVMGKLLWDSRLHADDEAEQLSGFKDCKWDFPITGKVCAATCVRVCVFVFRVQDRTRE